MLFLDRRRKPRAVVAVVMVTVAFILYLQATRSPFRFCGEDFSCSYFEGPSVQLSKESNRQVSSDEDIPRDEDVTTSEEFDTVDFHVESKYSETDRTRDVTNSYKANSKEKVVQEFIVASIKSDEKFFKVHLKSNEVAKVEADMTRVKSLDTKSYDAASQRLRILPSMFMLKSQNEISVARVLSTRTTSKYSATSRVLKTKEFSKYELSESNGNDLQHVIEPSDLGGHLFRTVSYTMTVPRLNSNGISKPFHFVIDVPGGCDQHTLGLIFVFSAPGNGKRRGVIRNTWASFKHRKLRILFLLGLSRDQDPSVEASIRQESLDHADLVQADFLDVYANLSLKSLAMLQWTSSNCPRVRFLVKADDDVLINTPLLLRDLQLTRHRRFVMGNVVAGARPVRDPASKWFTPTSVYKASFYPKYVSGAAYVISGDLVRELYVAAVSTELFWIEDVFVTGLLVAADGSGIPNVQHIYNGKFDINKEISDPCLLQKHLLRHLPDTDSIIGLWSIITTQSACIM